MQFVFLLYLQNLQGLLNQALESSVHSVHCFVQFRCNIAHRYYTHLSYLAPLVQFKLKPYLEIGQDNQLIA